MSADNFMAIIYEDGKYHGYHCCASLDYFNVEDYKRQGTYQFTEDTWQGAVDACYNFGYLEYGYDFINRPPDKQDILDLIWDTWLESHELIMNLPFDHYMVCVKEQLREAFLHYHQGKPDKAMNEVVDLISVSINWLVWFGQYKEDIRELVVNRVTSRMKDKTREIIEKYEQLRIDQDMSLWD